MKSILQSIKPQYCELIAAGKKTIEVRKTKPKLDAPFKVYIYCTKGENLWKKGNLVFLDRRYNRLLQTFDYMLNGKVIGEYVCDKIYQYTTCDFKDGTDIDDETMTRLSCLSKSEIESYELSPGQFGVFAWHISDLKIYDKPKELSGFVKCNMPSFDDLDGSEVLCDYCTMTDFGERKTFGFAAGDYYDCGGEECKEAYKSYIEDNQYLTRPPQSWCYVEEGQ